jgi:hypothetical protein
MSDNVVQMPGLITMREFTELDGGKWYITEGCLTDPALRRRLVRTQVEELFALYQHYPLPEFEAVRQVLTQLRQAYSDVEPFDHPMLAEMDEEVDD